MRALVFLVAVSCCAAQLALPYTHPWVLPYAKLDINPEDEILVKPVALPTPFLHSLAHPLAGHALGAFPYAHPLTYAVKPDVTLKGTEFPFIYVAAEEEEVAVEEPVVEEARRRRRREVVEVPLPYLHAVPAVTTTTIETKQYEPLEAATPADTTKIELTTKEREISIPAVKYVQPVVKYQPVTHTVVSPAVLPYSYGHALPALHYPYHPLLTSPVIKLAEDE